MRVMGESRDRLSRALREGELTVAVYGLGHVGVPLLAAWLSAGARGIGVDVDEAKVLTVASGRSPVEEPGVEEILRAALSSGRLKSTTDGVLASRESDVKLIAVPTKLRSSPASVEADLSALKSAARAIGEGLKEGDLVILESSVPPGTTRRVLRPILEEVSGLAAERDFGLAYSPERIYVGRALADIVERYPKVVGGVGPESARVAAALYREVSKRGVMVLSSDVAAEFEKLAEGVYRDVNIALANQLAILAARLGVEFEEIREAANSQPFCHLHRPGTGVGGACIPVYPHFLLEVAREVGADLKLVELARRINSEMPRHVAHLALEGTKWVGLNPASAIVCVLGLAFRGGVADTRLSPTYDLVRELLKLGFRNVRVHDPRVRVGGDLPHGVGLLSDMRAALEGCQVVVLSTDHPEYVGMSLAKLRELSKGVLRVVVDGRDCLDDRHVPEGMVYLAVGRPIKVGGSS